jgi:hypothetical protein
MVTGGGVLLGCLLLLVDGLLVWVSAPVGASGCSARSIGPIAEVMTTKLKVEVAPSTIRLGVSTRRLPAPDSGGT